jgi:hypothetical protein
MQLRRSVPLSPSGFAALVVSSIKLVVGRRLKSIDALLAADVNLTVLAGENLTVGGTSVPAV